MRGEHGPSLSLAVQLHWLCQQEILHPLSYLYVARVLRYHPHGVWRHLLPPRLLRSSRPSSVRRRVALPIRLHRSILLAFSISLCLFFFAGFHYWLVLHDKTTIESISSFSRFFSHSPATARRPVHYYENWCSVMDASPWIVASPPSLHRSGSSPFTAPPSPSRGIFSFTRPLSMLLLDVDRRASQI